MTKKRFRTLYDENYNAEVFATEVGVDEGLVQQHMRDECDINVIMARYQQTGELTHITAMAGEYGDFSFVEDYKTGIEQIMAADDLFMELPSSIRDRFKNDPGEFINFAINPENLEQMRDMGLAPKLSPAEQDALAASKGGARTSSTKPAENSDASLTKGAPNPSNSTPASKAP